MSKNNGQKENYTQLPHRVLEGLMRVNLSPLETRIVLTVIRWTYGYHREWCQLSYSRVSALAGVPRHGVYKSIKRLVARGIIDRRSSENGAGYEMKIAVSHTGDTLKGDSHMEVSLIGDGKSPEKEIEVSPRGEIEESPGEETLINKEIKVLKKVKSIMSDSEPSNGEMDTDQFEQFWKHYPRKDKKKDAIKAFKALKPKDKLLKIIIQDIEKKKKSPQWMNSMKNDSGQFIPLPATYIRGELWMDEGTEKLSKQGESWKD